MAMTGDEGHWGAVAIDLLQGEPLHADDLADLEAHLTYHPECPDGTYQ